jgi:hypothetical protein
LTRFDWPATTCADTDQVRYPSSWSLTACEPAATSGSVSGVTPTTRPSSVTVAPAGLEETLRLPTKTVGLAVAGGGFLVVVAAAVFSAGLFAAGAEAGGAVGAVGFTGAAVVTGSGLAGTALAGTGLAGAAAAAAGGAGGFETGAEGASGAGWLRGAVR